MTQRVTDLVRNGDADRGLLVCGTGVGAWIAANKFPGIRAAVIHDTYVARQGVEHDDVNVGCLGCWIVGPRIAEDVITAFLNARFDDTEDVRRRVAQLGPDRGRCPTGRAVGRRARRHDTRTLIDRPTGAACWWVTVSIEKGK